MRLSNYIDTLKTLGLKCSEKFEFTDIHGAEYYSKAPFAEQPFYQDAIDEILAEIYSMHEMVARYPYAHLLGNDFLGEWEQKFLDAQAKSLGVTDRNKYLKGFVEDELDIIDGQISISLELSLQGSLQLPFDEVLNRLVFLDSFCKAKKLDVEFMPEFPLEAKSWADKLLRTLKLVFERCSNTGINKYIIDFTTRVEYNWRDRKEMIERGELVFEMPKASVADSVKETEVVVETTPKRKRGRPSKKDEPLSLYLAEGVEEDTAKEILRAAIKKSTGKGKALVKIEKELIDQNVLAGYRIPYDVLKREFGDLIKCPMSTYNRLMYKEGIPVRD